MKSIKTYLMIVCVSCAGVLQAHAGVQSVRSVEKFNRAVKESELAIVMFYQEDRETRQDKELRRAIDNTQKYFKDASKEQEEAVTFISVNLSKDDVSDLQERYGIETVPTFLLFKDGSLKPFASQDGKIASLIGYPSVWQIVDFITDHFKKEIDEIIKRKQEEARRRAERRAWYGGPSFYLGWGGGPWYDWPGYYSSYYYPSYGFGWRRGYYW